MPEATAASYKQHSCAVRIVNGKYSEYQSTIARATTSSAAEFDRKEQASLS
jgi:hypothetical protein